MTIRPWRPLRHFAVLLLALTAVVSPDLQGQGRRARASVMVDGREAVDGEVLVRFRNAAAAFERARAEDEVEADEVEPVGRRGTRRMRARRLGTREMLARLRANPDVEFAEPNYIIRLAATPNDPSFGNLWGLFNFGQSYGGAGIAGADIDATLAWEVSTGTRVNVVGVIDTGIDYNHPDLAANIWTAPSAFSVTIGGVVINCAAGTHGFNAINNTCDPMDDHNHGTHVAGTIGAVGNNGVGVVGVNWTASMMGLKFLAANGSGTTSNAIKAIEFAVQAKSVLGSAANVRILSNSWGGGGYSQSLLDEINRANSHDMLFVAAAGNSNLNADVSPMYPAAYSAPNIISVAATDNRDQRAWFSNYGAASVDLGAPGVAILSTIRNNGYASFNGTSMATPHVSGSAALLLSTCTLGTSALKSAILNAVDPIPSMAGITTTGGRLNVDNAIRVCPPIANPVPSLASISPATVYAGTASQTVTVSGSGFVTGSDARFDGASRATTVANNSTLTFTLSAGDLAGVGTHAITVVNSTPGGGTSNSLTLNVLAPPTLTPAATIVAPGGTLAFTIGNGPGNARDWIGLFCPEANPDGTYSDFRYLNNAKIAPASGVTAATVTFAAPAPGVTCNARFFVDNGFTKLTTSATVTTANVVPTVTALTPSSVPAGSGASVMVTGTNFVAGSVVHVNGAARTTTFGSVTQLTATILAGDVATASANPLVTVVNPAPGGGASNSRTLTVVPAPTVTPTETTVASAGTATFTVTAGPGNARDWVGLFCPATGADGAYLDWKYLNNTRTAPASGVTGATVTLTAPPGATTCNARLFADNGFTKLATSAPVSVNAPGLTLTIDPMAVAPGGTFTVTVAGGPGNARDWVGLFCPTTAADGEYLDWKYLNNTRMAPASGVTAATVTLTAPAASTTCHARLFADNGFTKLATSATATVTGPTVTASSLDVTPGGTITVTVAHGPGNVRDWVGLYCPATNGDGLFTDWKYLNGTRTAPSGGMTAATLTFTAPSTTGTCNLRLFVDESFTRLAASATVAVH
jgi:hypothetical protein